MARRRRGGRNRSNRCLVSRSFASAARGTGKNAWHTLLVLGLGCGASPLSQDEPEPCYDLASPPSQDEPEPGYDFGCPGEAELACTGLYGRAGAYWKSKRLGDGIKRFAPIVELWSDHMQKERFVWLPPGETIDTSMEDEWVFPIGTRFWKEFSYEGQRIETRYLEKRGPQDWRAATYRWSADEEHAAELTEGELGVKGTFEDSYEVPTAADCKRCHGGAKDNILGFSALLLDGDSGQGLTLSQLQAEGRLSEPPLATQLGGTDAERAALLYLHVNCGLACHNSNPNAEAVSTGFRMKLEVGRLSSPADIATYRTGSGVQSYIRRPGAEFPMLRIAPGDPENSAIIYRAGQRDAFAQMPPLGSHVVDKAGLDLIRHWIASLDASE